MLVFLSPFGHEKWITRLEEQRSLVTALAPALAEAGGAVTVTGVGLTVTTGAGVGLAGVGAGWVTVTLLTTVMLGSMSGELLPGARPIVPATVPGMPALPA